jgi:hypothetical protein
MLWGVIVSICDLIWLTPWQDRLRDKASRIQEIFDCEVLELPWNNLKAGAKPDPELIIEQSNKYKKWEHKMPRIDNWYSKEVDSLPLYIGRIACQRSNCRWDAEQRRRYAAWTVLITALVFAILLFISCLNGLTLQKFILNVIAPFFPALLLGIRQYQEHTNTANKLDHLKDHAKNIWEQALSGKSEPEITAMSRNLQDEILENRRNKPFVFDRVYKYIQPNFELQMNYTVTELVQEWLANHPQAMTF